MIQRLVAASSMGVLIAALSLPGTAFAGTDPGASACQPAAGQFTAAVAQTGALGTLASTIATSQPGALAALNHESLFCT